MQPAQPLPEMLCCRNIRFRLKGLDCADSLLIVAVAAQLDADGSFHCAGRAAVQQSSNPAVQQSSSPAVQP